MRVVGLVRANWGVVVAVMATVGDAATAKATFEMANSVKSVPSVDSVFRYDQQKQQELLQAKPWEKE